MFLDFIREFVGELPVYQSGNSYGSTQYYGELLEYGFACILCLAVVVLSFRLLFYIVNLFRGKGARKV